MPRIKRTYAAPLQVIAGRPVERQEQPDEPISDAFALVFCAVIAMAGVVSITLLLFSLERA